MDQPSTSRAERETKAKTEAYLGTVALFDVLVVSKDVISKACRCGLVPHCCAAMYTNRILPSNWAAF